MDFCLLCRWLPCLRFRCVISLVGVRTAFGFRKVMVCLGVVSSVYGWTKISYVHLMFEELICDWMDKDFDVLLIFEELVCDWMDKDFVCASDA